MKKISFFFSAVFFCFVIIYVCCLCSCTATLRADKLWYNGSLVRPNGSVPYVIVPDSL